MEIQEITINSEKYPDKLKNIYDPPQVLYAIGNIEILNQQIIAIVGTRKATEYGKKTALELLANDEIREFLLRANKKKLPLKNKIFYSLVKINCKELSYCFCILRGAIKKVIKGE